MKILIITDSLGCPRVYPEYLPSTQAWPIRLQEKYPNNVVYVSMPGLTTKRLYNEISNYLKAYEVDAVIIQVGIVDCAPRALTQNELKILSRIPIVNRVVRFFVKKYRSKMVSFRKVTYTNVRDFRYYTHAITSCFNNKILFFLPIAPPTKAYEEYNPGVSSNVSCYNSILSENAMLIDVYSGCDSNSIYMEDYHHLNKEGHNLIFNRVSDRIEVILKGLTCVS